MILNLPSRVTGDNFYDDSIMSRWLIIIYDNLYPLLLDLLSTTNLINNWDSSLFSIIICIL